MLYMHGMRTVEASCKRRYPYGHPSLVHSTPQKVYEALGSCLEMTPFGPSTAYHLTPCPNMVHTSPVISYSDDTLLADAASLRIACRKPLGRRACH
jgi:hypothetical protein